MYRSKWTFVGFGCLVLGPLGQLAQYLVTPLKGDATAAEQVAAVAVDLSSMRLALVLDVVVLLIIPAVLFVGVVAGARSSWLAMTGTALAFGGYLSATVLVAQDALIYEAARRPDATAAAALVEAYTANGLVSGLLLTYLAAHTIGLILLGIALVRSRAVPVLAGVALAASPVLDIVGFVGGLTVLVVLASALLVAVFAACGVALVRRPSTRAATPIPGS
jgi:hypothetical protein